MNYSSSPIQLNVISNLIQYIYLFWSFFSVIYIYIYIYMCVYNKEWNCVQNVLHMYSKLCIFTQIFHICMILLYSTQKWVYHQICNLVIYTHDHRNRDCVHVRDSSYNCSVIICDFLKINHYLNYLTHTFDFIGIWITPGY